MDGHNDNDNSKKEINYLVHDEGKKLLQEMRIDDYNRWRMKNLTIKPDISGDNLSGKNLSGADLNGALLMYCDMKECNLADANLTKANFMWTNLQGSNLTPCIISRTNFVEANLTNAKLPNVGKQEAYTKYARLQGTLWS